jgi:UrcA family protein
MRNSTAILAATVMLAALCCRAHADTSTDEPPTHITGRIAVHYGDLDLKAEQDAKIMLQRIERAAKKACGGHPDFSSYTGSLDSRTFEECRGRAIQRAVRQLGAPMVTRIYLGRSGLCGPPPSGGYDGRPFGCSIRRGLR